jgi:hypothetical protein
MTRDQSLRSRLAARCARPEDDRGSMPLLMLVMLIGVSISSLLIPMIITQNNATRVAISRVHSLDAAQAGFDVVLGEIRTATSSAGDGLAAKLPCTDSVGHFMDNPEIGTVSVASRARYQVYVSYFDADPSAKSVAWQSSNHIRCVPGFGTQHVPAFALMQSTGTDRATGAFGGTNDRTLTTTYTFKTDNQNISGGLVRIYHDATKNNLDLCMDAGSANPASGTTVLMQMCSNPKTAQQLFSYNSDLSIQLVASSPAMCLDAGPLPHTTPAVNVTFRPCTTPAAARQQWSIDDTSDFQGSTSTGSLDNFCFNIQNSNTVGSPVVLDKSCGNYSITQTWVPEPAVGAGAAGQSINGNPPPQLVNFQQFGRCLDVTNQNVASTFMIAYPCKQAPNPANVAPNQKFSYNSTNGEFITISGGSNYCMLSPGTVGGYVLFTACPPGTPPTNLKWTYNGTTDSSGNQLPYVRKFTIVDSSTPSLCLGLSPDSDQYNGAYNKVIVTTCDGSLSQKWNADPNVQNPALLNTSEK